MNKSLAWILAIGVWINALNPWILPQPARAVDLTIEEGFKRLDELKELAEDNLKATKLVHELVALLAKKQVGKGKKASYVSLEAGS